MITRIEIQITAENLWFLERQLNVFDFTELFPPDAISKEGGPGVPIVLKTDRGFSIRTDIDGSKMVLRNRSRIHGWTRWTSEHELRIGDRIVIEKLADREYLLTILRNIDGSD